MSETVKFSQRSAARLACVQGLFLMQFHEYSQEQTYEDLLEYYTETSDKALDTVFCQQILSNAKEHQDFTRKIISANLSDKWSLERMNSLMLAIMTTALLEIIVFPEVDIPLVLAEYTNIAHNFFDKNEANFIHSTLKEAAPTLRP